VLTLIQIVHPTVGLSVRVDFAARCSPLATRAEPLAYPALTQNINDNAAFRRPVRSNSITKKIWSGRRGSNPRPKIVTTAEPTRQGRKRGVALKARFHSESSLQPPQDSEDAGSAMSLVGHYRRFRVVRAESVQALETRGWPVPIEPSNQKLLMCRQPKWQCAGDTVQRGTRPGPSDGALRE
jgi:hypothetical protein